MATVVSGGIRELGVLQARSKADDAKLGPAVIPWRASPLKTPRATAFVEAQRRGRRVPQGQDPFENRKAAVPTRRQLDNTLLIYPKTGGTHRNSISMETFLAEFPSH